MEAKSMFSPDGDAADGKEREQIDRKTIQKVKVNKKQRMDKRKGSLICSCGQM